MNREPLSMRTFELAWLADPENLATSAVFTKTINAAYWTTDGDSRRVSAEPHELVTLDFISFKDTDNKPVYTIRRSMVLSIQEMRDPLHEFVDRPFYQVTTDVGTRSYAAPDHKKILTDVVRGRLSIDAARDLMGLAPFNLPETIVPLAYTKCPNGCGEKGTCMECPQYDVAEVG